MAYMETENFWEKIHQQRVQGGEIIGWDLWALAPGGEEQGYQYMTVTLFNTAEAMFGGGNFITNVTKAYPDKSEEELRKKIGESSKTRDLAVRIYLEEIAKTNGSFDMPLGTVAYINFMKAEMGSYSTYEKAEMEVFQPSHQRSVDNGKMGSWGLLRFMLPYGSDAYATHITVDMYKDINQALNREMAGSDGDKPSEQQMKAINAGIASRDMKWTNMARLIKKVR
jgi:hypothetical protein